MSARDRLRSEGYRVSDAAELTKQNVKGDIAGLSASFVITGPEHKRWTGIDAAGFQTVAHMARPTNEVETHAVYIALCIFFFDFLSCQIGGQGTGRRPAPAPPEYTCAQAASPMRP